MTRAAFDGAIRFEHFILDSIARGITDVLVGSGALLAFCVERRFEAKLVEVID
jgi:hypothetical protein